MTLRLQQHGKKFKRLSSCFTLVTLSCAKNVFKIVITMPSSLTLIQYIFDTYINTWNTIYIWLQCQYDSPTHIVIYCNHDMIVFSKHITFQLFGSEFPSFFRFCSPWLCRGMPWSILGVPFRRNRLKNMENDSTSMTFVSFVLSFQHVMVILHGPFGPVLAEGRGLTGKPIDTLSTVDDTICL